MVDHPSPDSGALDAWVWDAAADDYVRTGSAMPEEAVEVVGVQAAPISPEEFERLFPEERFRSAVGATLRFGGGLARLKTLDIDNSDPAFAAAVEVAYRRLLAGPNAYLIKWLSNRDLLDLLIIGSFVGPLAQSVGEEIKSKKSAAAVPPASCGEAEEEGTDGE